MMMSCAFPWVSCNICKWGMWLVDDDVIWNLIGPAVTPVNGEFLCLIYGSLNGPADWLTSDAQFRFILHTYNYVMLSLCFPERNIWLFGVQLHKLGAIGCHPISWLRQWEAQTKIESIFLLESDWLLVQTIWKTTLTCWRIGWWGVSWVQS